MIAPTTVYAVVLVFKTKTFSIAEAIISSITAYPQAPEQASRSFPNPGRGR